MSPEEIEIAQGSCWLFHKWTMWRTTGDVKDDGKVVGKLQERTCTRCGRLQMRSATIYYGEDD